MKQLSFLSITGKQIHIVVWLHTQFLPLNSQNKAIISLPNLTSGPFQIASFASCLKKRGTSLRGLLGSTDCFMNNFHFKCSALIQPPRILENELYCSYSVFVLPLPFRTQHYMRNALVSRHWHIACLACFIAWLKRRRPILHVWRSCFASWL